MSILLALFSAVMSFAYIPEYSLIASRTAEQHGRGGYLVEQEVTFHRGDTEAYTLKETWLVLNENNLRLTLEGKGSLKGMVQGSVIFEGGLKSFIDAGAQAPRNQRLGEEWLEPLFYFRNPKYFRSRLVNLKVAPAESLRDRPSLNTEGDPVYEPPGFVRLSRVGGTTAWAIGMPAATGNHPMLWIEQDQFVMRKMRTVNQAVVRADDYVKYDEGLWYPHKQTYTFGNYTVDVQTLAVKSLGKLKADDARFRPASLNVSRDALKLPDVEPLKEFYSRFR